MTDNLRDAAQAVLDRWDSRDWKAASTADYMNRLRAVLAAAPQPAVADREALVEVIAEARGRFTPNEMAWAGDGYHDEERAIADALLARGLRLSGGEETMAWAVVGETGEIELVYVGQDRRELAEMIAENTEGKAVPVAIRVVGGGDDAA